MVMKIFMICVEVVEDVVDANNDEELVGVFAVDDDDGDDDVNDDEDCENDAVDDGYDDNDDADGAGCAGCRFSSWYGGDSAGCSSLPRRWVWGHLGTILFSENAQFNCLTGKYSKTWIIDRNMLDLSYLSHEDFHSDENPRKDYANGSPDLWFICYIGSICSKDTSPLQRLLNAQYGQGTTSDISKL